MGKLMEYFGEENKGMDDIREQVESLPNAGKNGFSGSNVQFVFNTAYAMAGVLAVIFIIVGGISYILAAGDPGKTKKAQGTVVNAVVGLVIVLLAAAITNFVLAAISGGD